MSVAHDEFSFFFVIHSVDFLLKCCRLWVMLKMIFEEETSL